MGSARRIRGGYFVGGIGGEQFALPEAIGLLVLFASRSQMVN